MKNWLIILLITSTLCCKAQQIEVMLLGTSHYFKDEYKSLQNFDKIKNHLVDYAPDIICIEAIPTYDTASIIEIWPNTMKRATTLGLSLDSGKFTSANEQQLIGAGLYSSWDFWNAYFMWDSIGQVSEGPGPFGKYHRNLTNSEYGNIVYPAAREMNIDYLHPIDYRVGESTFLANNNKVLKKLVFNLKWKPVKTYLKIQKQYKKAEKDGLLMEFVNGPVFQNAFSNLIEELPNRLPKSDEAQAVKSYWHKRNKIMAARITEVAKGTEAQKVLVTVGSAHVGLIKHYLEQSRVKVVTYGDQLVNNSK